MGMSAVERQRRYREKKRVERESLPRIPCKCGCGTMIPSITSDNKPAQYAHGHNPNPEFDRTGKPSWNKGKPYPIASKTHKGKKLTPEMLAKRKATRLANNGGVYQVTRGWKHTDETRNRMRIAVNNRDLSGPANPFFGKTHTDETRARLSENHSGPNSSQWKGGTGTLPYGPEFTRKYKRILRQRDNYTCQRCGKTQKEEGRTLQIHHKDHDMNNNSPDNLVTVCASCNVWCSWHKDEPFQPIQGG